MNTLLKPFFAVVPLSLEELFAEELKKLGIEKFRLEKGGCWFGAEMSQMMQVNLWTRYASRILLKVTDRKSTRLNSSHTDSSRMPSSA